MGEQYTGSTRIFSLKQMGEILSQGVPLESVDKDGKTFLRHACADGKRDIAQLLLDAGADTNSRDNEGKTSLMAAAMTGRLEVVELLLRYGADPLVESAGGDSAIKIAQRWRKEDILLALLEKTEMGDGDQNTVPFTAVRTSSQPMNEQMVYASVERVAAKPTPSRKEEPVLPEIVPKSGIVEAEVVDVVARPVAGPGLPSRGGATGEVNITTTVVDVTVRDPEPPAPQDGFKIPELTTEEYIQALETMKQSPKDRVGMVAVLGGTGLGVIAGTAASGSIAAALGVTTLLGSSTLGTVLGGVLVTTTPVGWVIGAAAAAGAIGYGISKLVRSGARADVIKEMNIKDLHAEIETRKSAVEKTGVAEEKYKGLVESLQLLVKNNRISQGDCTELLRGVQGGLISYEYAFGTFEKLSQE